MEDLKKIVASLYKEGKTQTEIGLQIGKTKNAVAGIIRRLGIANRGSPIKQAKRSADYPKGLLELGAKECHYPMDDKFCGKPALRAYGYCTEHHNKCFRK